MSISTVRPMTADHPKARKKFCSKARHNARYDRTSSLHALDVWMAQNKTRYVVM
jgi:hypothetical protein